jgi:hypothetical protein
LSRGARDAERLHADASAEPSSTALGKMLDVADMAAQPRREKRNGSWIA